MRRTSWVMLALAVGCGNSDTPSGLLDGSTDARVDGVNEAAADAESNDSSSVSDGCVPPTTLATCIDVTCPSGEYYCTLTGTTTSHVVQCSGYDGGACGCASCGCVTVPAGCTCSTTLAAGVVVDCRK